MCSKKDANVEQKGVYKEDKKSNITKHKDSSQLQLYVPQTSNPPTITKLPPPSPFHSFCAQIAGVITYPLKTKS